MITVQGTDTASNQAATPANPDHTAVAYAGVHAHPASGMISVRGTDTASNHTATPANPDHARGARRPWPLAAVAAHGGHRCTANNIAQATRDWHDPANRA
jgi:hypothetical protein